MNFSQSLLVFLLLSLAAPLTAASTWVPMPLITPEMKQAGISPGGEGAQVIRTLAVSPSDPNFLMMGTDVGGIYRTLDGGKHWQVCMSGWLARGANAFAIDPKNPKRILGVGGNSLDWNPDWGASPTGLYLSTDQGASWKQVLPRPEGFVTASALAWDPASYDPRTKRCTVAYYESRDSGLFRTEDGGATWSVVNAERKDGAVAVHSAKGFVYSAGGAGDGFYKSKDGGRTFRRVAGLALRNLAVIPTRPDSVYVCGADKVQVSDDAGETFHPAGANAGLPEGAALSTLGVSPADPSNMLCSHGGTQWWENFTYYSKDGGASWHKVSYRDANRFLPFTQSGSHFVFDPVHPGQAISDLNTNGSIVKTTDGGETFIWSGNGENAVMTGGGFGFSPHSPNTVFIAFQDFNGARTLDGGHTWTYCNPSGQGWGGFGYGGFALNAQVMWTGDAPGWTGPRTLKVSRDGGATWTAMKDAAGQTITYGGSDVSFADPAEGSVCFASRWRSADKALTWAAMTGCDAVYTASPAGAKELYGKHGDAICRSSDHGLTWTDITPAVPGGLRDIAVDPVQARVYAASEDRVKFYTLVQGTGGAWQECGPLPKDSKGSTHAWSVAVDPKNPAVMYAAGPANIYATDATLSRSVDAGKTWANMTVTQPLANAAQPGGPHEVSWVRVHPVTRDLWAAGECYGLWRLPAP